jgi:hypothetical protein
MSYGEGGGVWKVPKKCHVLFEWPLMSGKLPSHFTFTGEGSHTGAVQTVFPIHRTVCCLAKFLLIRPTWKKSSFCDGIVVTEASTFYGIENM